MRIMVDANVLVSAIILDSKRMDELFECIFAKHTLVIASYTVTELIEVAEEKFPDRLDVVEKSLERMPYELARTPDEIEPDLYDVRDPDDYPVLYTAVKAEVDVLVTGDKDLLAVKIKSPEILMPSEFLERYA